MKWPRRNLTLTAKASNRIYASFRTIMCSDWAFIDIQANFTADFKSARTKTTVFSNFINTSRVSTVMCTNKTLVRIQTGFPLITSLTFTVVATFCVDTVSLSNALTIMLTYKARSECQTNSFNVINFAYIQGGWKNFTDVGKTSTSLENFQHR